MVHFSTADVDYILRDKEKIRKWLSRVARSKKASIDQLNVILCSDGFLYKMNVEHLGHHTLTDIITFDYSTSRKQLNGEIYISLDRIRDNANALKNTIKDEMHRVIAHGLLHLCGYTDNEPKSKALMRKLEDQALLERRF